MKLYVFGGIDDYEISTRGFSYRINTGHITGDYTSLDNLLRFNEIALNVRDEYCEYISSHNKSYFLKYGFVFNNVSLYFFSDLSNKRTEIYNTFHFLCHAIHIKELCKINNIDTIYFVKCDQTFVKMFIGNDFGLNLESDSYNLTNNYTITKRSLINIIYKQCVFFIKVMIAWIVNRHTVNKKHIDRLYLTRYPLHLHDDGTEDKYQSAVNSDGTYLVSILTDGLHQNLNLFKLLLAFKQLRKTSNYILLDSYITLNDIYIFIKYSIKMINAPSLNKSSFMGFDMTELLMVELRDSFLRIPRLLLYYYTIIRVFTSHNVNILIYYLHEYCYGRLFTIALKQQNIKTILIGFQHGPASWRKLLYSLSPNELLADSTGTNKLEVMPLPDKILCEDIHSKEIYKYYGYKDVEVMKVVPRLQYLESVQYSFGNNILVIGGLHDSQVLYKYALNLSLVNKDRVIFFKRHPMSKVKFQVKKHIKSFVCSDLHISELLAKACEVHVTYSSVGYEGLMLGKVIYLLLLPNRINESPLMDIADNNKNIILLSI
jgi:hypothetical protein